MTQLGTDGLATRRKELGLDLAQVASETKIPLRYLEAIEAGRLHELPAGPYRHAYVRAYREALGLTSSVYVSPAPGSPAPVSSVQTPARWGGYVAMLAVAAVAAGLLWWVGVPTAPSDESEPVVVRLKPPASEPEVASEVPGPNQVSIQMRLSSAMTVIVDHQVLHDRVFSGGEVIEVSAEERVEIEIPAVNRIRVTHGGKSVVPQGNQHIPRRLVFIQDQGE